MSFEEALDHTLQFEGGYANDPADRGGETFRGISRVSHPDWPGWAEIDHYKRELARRDGISNWRSKANWRKLDAVTANDRDLARLVAEFYRKKFWKPFDGGDAA